MITFILKKLSLPQQKNVVASIGNFLASRKAENLTISLYSLFGKYIEVAYQSNDKILFSVSLVSKKEIKELYSCNEELLKELKIIK